MDAKTLHLLGEQRRHLEAAREGLLVERPSPATTQEQVNHLQAENDAMRQEIAAIKSRLGDGVGGGKEVLRKSGQMRLL